MSWNGKTHEEGASTWLASDGKTEVTTTHRTYEEFEDGFPFYSEELWINDETGEEFDTEEELNAWFRSHGYTDDY
jgi:hypothetical protein